MNIIEAKQAIDIKIAEYTKDLKSPLGCGYEDNIRGIISGLKEAKKIISKIKLKKQGDLKPSETDWLKSLKKCVQL